VPGGTNLEDYPPEFNLSVQDLRRYRIIPIWAASEDPIAQAKLFKEWRANSRAFPAWVSQQIYAQRRAKYGPPMLLEEWDLPDLPARPGPRQRYADDLAASPKLLTALGGGQGKVFQAAGLSNQEQAVMRMVFDGIEPGEIARQLGLSWGNYANVRKRAVLKLKTTFVVVPPLFHADTLTQGETL
jgi:DNA-binding CsgD family transcriptional regulator